MRQPTLFAATLLCLSLEITQAQPLPAADLPPAEASGPLDPPAALARWVALPEHPLEQRERLEQLRPLAAGLAIGVAVIDERPARGIDTEHDLEQANAHWAGFHSGLN